MSAAADEQETSSAILAASLIAVLAAEERRWRAEGNSARAERFAALSRIVSEDAARTGGRSSHILQPLADLYRLRG